MELNELNLSDEQLTLVQKMIQSETDKVRTEYSKQLKTVNEELSKYKPEPKSESELALEEKIKELENKENELNAIERRYNISKF